MLRIKLVCVGKIKESWLAEGIAEYAKRLQRFCKLAVVEVEESKLPDKPSAKQVQQALMQEGAEMLKHCEGTAVCLDIAGSEFGSEQLADWLGAVPLTASAVTFFVGGSHGICPSVKDACKRRISFGKITLPHQLFRVVLLEQLYRAFMIAGGGEYHK